MNLMVTCNIISLRTSDMNYNLIFQSMSENPASPHKRLARKESIQNDKAQPCPKKVREDPPTLPLQGEKNQCCL